jgi:hypothetical protein
LEAGRRLIAAQVTPRPAVARDSEREIDRPVLSWLDTGRVFDEMRRGPMELPQQPSDGSFKYRWELRSHYIVDLVSYVNWLQFWEAYTRHAAQSRKEMLEAASFSSSLHEAAYVEMELATRDDIYPTQVHLQPLALADPRIRESLQDLYDSVFNNWTPTYEALFEKNGWKLRPNMTFEKLSIMLTAEAEGIGLRTMV